MLTLLDATSPLVILWANGTIHTSKSSKKYLKLLDLSSGKALLSQCNQIWPHYGEVIKNRKKCILNLILDNILRKKITQVAVLGSGLDALSLEIASRVKGVTVYETDATQMDLKRSLIKQADPKLCNSIKCITSDLTDTQKTLDDLVENGWDGSKPSVLIFEGISYFLTEKNLWNLIGMFKTKNQQNVLLLEYLLDASLVSKDRSKISGQVFDAIQKGTGLGNTTLVTRYMRDQIECNLEKFGGRVTLQYTMKDMEKDRVGHNIHFKTSKSGWIEICQISI